MFLQASVGVRKRVMLKVYTCFKVLLK